MSKRRENKYYRIVGKNAETSMNSTGGPSGDLKDLLGAITSQRKYLYIDMREERGFKLMQECGQSEQQQEVEQAGGCFIANLDSSSRDNRNSIAYLLKLREINKQKELAFRLIDDQLQQSQLKLKKKKSIFLDEALARHYKKDEKRVIYNGMDPGLLEKYRNSSELDSIDHEIKQRETRLLNNYSTIPTHRPAHRPPPTKRGSLLPVLSHIINTAHFHQ